MARLCDEESLSKADIWIPFPYSCIWMCILISGGGGGGEHSQRSKLRLKSRPHRTTSTQSGHFFLNPAKALNWLIMPVKKMLWNYAAPIFLAPALEKAGSSRTESSMITVFTSYPPWSALVPVDNEIEGRFKGESMGAEGILSLFGYCHPTVWLWSSYLLSLILFFFIPKMKSTTVYLKVYYDNKNDFPAFQFWGTLRTISILFSPPWVQASEDSLYCTRLLSKEVSLGAYRMTLSSHRPWVIISLHHSTMRRRGGEGDAYWTYSNTSRKLNHEATSMCSLHSLVCCSLLRPSSQVIGKDLKSS